MLRHTLATVAYQLLAPWKAPPITLQVLPAPAPARADSGHMGDLFDWALSTAIGQESWKASQPRRPGPRSSAASSSRSRPWTPFCLRCAAARPGRAAFPGPRGRCAHPRGPVCPCCAASPEARARGELFCCRDQGRPGGRNSARGGQAVQGALAKIYINKALSS